MSVNRLFLEYCRESKGLVCLGLASGQSPYFDTDDLENGELQYREEYVAQCLETACRVWEQCGFSDDLTVVYEDKFSCHHKQEKELIESTLKPLDFQNLFFEWKDDGEIFHGIRYVWKTNYLDVRTLFLKIILSEIGEDTQLDCAVYIIDRQTENIFFLYDDRGIQIYSDQEAFLKGFQQA